MHQCSVSLSAAPTPARTGPADRLGVRWLYSLWGKILEDSKDYDGAIAKFSEAARLQEAPWSDYAKKQIARQSKLKQREKMIAGQMENP